MSDGERIPALLFGHSHVWGVRQAINREMFQPSQVDIKVILCGTKEFPGSLHGYSAAMKPMLNPALLAALSRHEGDAQERTWLISMAQGNYYNQFGMVATGRSFDFTPRRNDQGSPVPESLTLPYWAVREALAAAMSEFSVFTRMMASTGFAGLVCVGPPPPPETDDPIREMVEKQTSADAGVSITPVATRLKLWHMQNELARGDCLKHGLTYVDGAVEGTRTSEGLLLTQYVKDAVHANAAYSAKLLAKIEAAIVEAERSGSQREAA